MECNCNQVVEVASDNELTFNSFDYLLKMVSNLTDECQFMTNEYDKVSRRIILSLKKSSNSDLDLLNLIEKEKHNIDYEETILFEITYYMVMFKEENMLEKFNEIVQLMQSIQIIHKYTLSNFKNLIQNYNEKNLCLNDKVQEDTFLLIREKLNRL